MVDSTNTKSENEIELERADIIQAIERYQVMVDRGKSLEIMRKDPHFQAVILDGYIGDLATMLFDQLTVPESMRAVRKEDCERKMESICDLKSYIGFDGFIGDIDRDALRAKEAIESLETQLSKIG
jgi:hypothetical protein